MQREEIDLAHRAPVGSHLRDDAGRQGHLGKTFEDSFAVPKVLFVVVENQLQIRQPKQRERSQMRDVWNAVHHDFQEEW